MVGPLDRNIRPKRAEFKKALAESKQKKAAAAASGVSLVELRDYSEKRKEFVEEYGEELVSDAEKFVRKKEESLRAREGNPDFRFDLETRLGFMDSWLKREKAKQNRISGSGFKKKKENADKGIDQQSDQNFLLQNYSKLKDNAPEPWTMPRLTIVTSQEENLLNVLTIKDKMKELLDASSADINSLVPYIRFYKRDKNEGRDRIREFKFSKGSGNLNEYFASGAKSGSEVGLKSFNMNMTGTNQFTSTRNFQGNLVLFFKSLADMDDTRSFNGQMPWTELLFNHMFEESPDLSILRSQIAGAKSGAEKRKFERDLRTLIRDRKGQIYVEFGYDFSDNVLDRKALQESVKSTRMLLALYPISTNFTFAQDGSAELSIEFTAASESIGDDIDANVLTLGSTDKELSDIDNLREQIKAQDKKIEDLGDNPNKETKEDIEDDIRKIEEKLSKAITQNRISNYGRFIEHLYKNKRLFSVTVKEENYKKGVWKLAKGKDAGSVAVSENEGQEILAKSQEELKNENSDDGYLDTTKDKWGNHTVGYFFLGDLLNYAAYALVQPDLRTGMNGDPAKTESARKAVSMGMAYRDQSAEVVLGDYTYFEYPPEEDYDKDPGAWIANIKSRTVNLSKLPISYSLYHSFMREVIVNFTGTVMSFDYFLKETINRLVVAAMSSPVKNRKAADVKLKRERKDGMQIARVTGYSEKLKESRIKAAGPSGPAILDVVAGEVTIERPELSAFLESGVLDDSSLPTNFIIVHGSRKRIAGTVGTDPNEDAKKGIYHMVAGSRTGIVKSIDFRQTSTRLKEINLQKYLQDGQIDGASILRMPYDADVTIFGNPGFYPGQYIFLRPSYVGLGDLNTANSIAGKLGLGGLYNLIGVSTRLTPGKLETTLTCIQNNAASPPSMSSAGEDATGGIPGDQQLDQQTTVE
jgi:hypothetical protein